MASLRAARREARLKDRPALIQLPTRQVARLEPSSGFDDFIVTPYDPAELYARIRALEWKRSEFSTEERLKVGGIVIDRAAHEVTLDGAGVTLTAKEFALLAYLAANRGRVFSRDVLLARVWGARYEGGARTVDIHVRRLRAKLGDGLPLETLRGAGYKLRAPAETGSDERAGEASTPPEPRGAHRGRRDERAARAQRGLPERHRARGEREGGARGARRGARAARGNVRGVDLRRPHRRNSAIASSGWSRRKRGGPLRQGRLASGTPSRIGMTPARSPGGRSRATALPSSRGSTRRATSPPRAGRMRWSRVR